MPLLTTVIGSYPKPSYLQIPDWFFAHHSDYTPQMYNKYLLSTSHEERVAVEVKGMREVVEEQIGLGLDIITDGEVTRENYIFHFCRHLNGIDFENPTSCTYRNGALTADLPTATSRVTSRGDVGWTVEEWRRAQSLSSKPVKMTLPGPMTICSTSSNKFYQEVKDLAADLVKCVNKEVLALAAAGCQYIQVDEPVLVREPERAMQYGIEFLAKCFQGVDAHVTKCIHLCCGYPSYLDQTDYLKADPQIYQQLAEQIDNAGFNIVSIEDAHRHNDLSLFDRFKKVTLTLGVITVASSRVETEEEIHQRVTQVLRHIPKERLILAPDCGLGFLPSSILKEKIANMVKAAKRFD